MEEEEHANGSDSESYKIDSCAEETGEDDDCVSVSNRSTDSEYKINMRRTF